MPSGEEPSQLAVSLRRFRRRRNWLPAWVHDGHDIPYILVLVGGDGAFRLFDPREGNELSFQSRDYDAAKNWLAEDEFEIVGRKDIDADSYWRELVKR